MAEGEKIDVVKAVTSPFTGLYWVKTIMYGLGLAALLGIGFCVWRTFNPKPTQTIHAAAGSNVSIHNETKRSFIPFTEVYTMKEKGDEGLGYGIRLGVRWEF